MPPAVLAAPKAWATTTPTAAIALSDSTRADLGSPAWLIRPARSRGNTRLRGEIMARTARLRAARCDPAKQGTASTAQRRRPRRRTLWSPLRAGAKSRPRAAACSGSFGPPLMAPARLPTASALTWTRAARLGLSGDRWSAAREMPRHGIERTRIRDRRKDRREVENQPDQARSACGLSDGCRGPAEQKRDRRGDRERKYQGRRSLPAEHSHQSRGMPGGQESLGELLAHVDRA